jgi:hypothetical protein
MRMRGGQDTYAYTATQHVLRRLGVCSSDEAARRAVEAVVGTEEGTPLLMHRPARRSSALGQGPPGPPGVGPLLTGDTPRVVSGLRFAGWRSASAKAPKWKALISMYIGTIPVSGDPRPAEQSISIGPPPRTPCHQRHDCEGRRSRET